MSVRFIVPPEHIQFQKTVEEILKYFAYEITTVNNIMTITMSGHNNIIDFWFTGRRIGPHQIHGHASLDRTGDIYAQVIRLFNIYHRVKKGEVDIHPMIPHSPRWIHAPGWTPHPPIRVPIAVYPPLCTYVPPRAKLVPSRSPIIIKPAKSPSP